MIEWQPTGDCNVTGQNDTADHRFFDATPHAYRCAKKTIEVDLPRENEFLAQYDQFRARMEAIVDVPDRTVDLLFRFEKARASRSSRG